MSKSDDRPGEENPRSGHWTAGGIEDAHAAAARAARKAMPPGGWAAGSFANSRVAALSYARAEGSAWSVLRRLSKGPMLPPDLLAKVRVLPFGVDWSKAWMSNPVVLQSMQRSVEAITRHYREVLEPLTKSVSSGLRRILLPPNLRDQDEIQPLEVFNFVKEEGIPLYGVPSASVALRLLHAKDHAARRQVLGACFERIEDDCEVVLARCTEDIVETEVHFVRDAIGALRNGNHHAAQALCTLTLDTLIPRFWETQNRKTITNRKRGEDVPELIKGLEMREALVWLPIWNAHAQFWVKNGDRIPHEFSRHATVHAVSRRQYSKRNTAQVLMLVTSLISYANGNARAG